MWKAVKAAGQGVVVYRYGFNGKENDNEIKGEGNQQDYGMRIYDPRIAKFLSVDPLSPKYPWYTPYQFAGNTPIQAIDLDGAEEWMMHQAFATKRTAEIKIVRQDQIARDKLRILMQIPEPHIMMKIDGVIQMGPQSVVLRNAAIAQERYNEALGEAIRGGIGGSAGYLIGGDKGAFLGAGVDGVAMSFAGIPAGNSSVFPHAAEIEPGRFISNTEFVRPTRGKIALDANALIGAIERGEKAEIIKAIGTDIPIVPLTAAKEFLKKGNINQLKGFMNEIGARIVSNSGTQAQVQQIMSEAQGMGRSLRAKDAGVTTTAENNGAAVLTRDKKLFNFLKASNRNVRTY